MIRNRIQKYFTVCSGNPFYRHAVGALPFIFLFSLFFILRAYRLFDRALFQGDQALDMIVVSAMAHQGIRPTAGALLSIDAISVPPYFYYILYAFFELTHSYVGVLVGTLVGSFIPLFFIMGTAGIFAGPAAAVIAGFLVSISSVFVFSAINIWDPIPGMWFLSAAMFLVGFGWKRNNFLVFITGLVHYVLSVAIYPGPVVLLPLASGITYAWYRQNPKASTQKALLYTCLTLGGIFVSVYLPQIVTESYFGWPTVHAIIQALATASGQLQHNAMLLLENSEALGAIIFPVPESFLGIGAMLLFGFIASVVYIIRTARAMHPGIRRILTEIIIWSLIGFPAVLLYQGPTDGHRLWAYLPLFIVGTAVCTVHAYTAGYVQKILATLILAAYGITNLYAVSVNIRYPQNQIALTQAAARVIAEDVHTRNISPPQVTMTYADASGTNDYEATSVLYWLNERYGFPLGLSPTGNSLASPWIFRRSGPVLYMICDACQAKIPDGYSEVRRIHIRPGYAVLILLPTGISPTTHRP